MREFLSTVQNEATIVRGRCLSYGDGITYWALAGLLRAAATADEADDAATVRAKIDGLVAADTDAARVAGILASVLGIANSAATSDDIAWAFRRTLALLADQRPLVVLVEDIHWAEPPLLDLLESVVDRSSRAPILLLCPARQELSATRADWAGARPNATAMQLEPLDAERASDLIDVLPGGHALPTQLRRRILEASEGNPLFVEEFLAMLVDQGHLRPVQGGGWAAATTLEDVAVPRSISLLLAARLDSLDDGDRRVAQRASVVGRIFERGAIDELSPRDERASLGGRLLSLTRRQVIRPDLPGLDGDDAFRFRHVLIRDAAYDALTKAERADLHERCGRWLVAAVGERFDEYVEIIAHHFAQAAEYRLGLSTLDERPGLAREAVAMLLSAADRSEQVHAHLEAVRLLRRALELMPAGHDEQRALRVQVLERAAEDARVAQEPDWAWIWGPRPWRRRRRARIQPRWRGSTPMPRCMRAMSVTTPAVTGTSTRRGSSSPHATSRRSAPPYSPVSAGSR